MSALPYLQNYSAALQQQVSELLAAERLGPWLQQRYPAGHDVQTDKALYQYVAELKQRYLKNAVLPAKICFDNQQHPVKGTLGTHTHISRVQGGKLKAKSEIRIAAVLREAPLPLLHAVVVHELAHLREKNHDKSFYQLCCHIEPDYHQLELDLRLWLTWRERAA